VFQGSFLVVEGDTDARLLKRIVDITECTIIIAYNRSNAVEINSILDQDDFVCHIALIDQDYAGLLGEEFHSENIVLTQFNDMESMIFSGDAFERMINEYCNENKVSALKNAHSSELREILLNNATKIGVLRYLSKALGWELNFEDMSYRYVRRADVAINVDDQIEHLRGRSHSTSMPILTEVKKRMSVLIAGSTDPYAYVCGHDLCEIISHAIHDVVGRSHQHLSRGGQAVEEVLRAAYTWQNFVSSSVYQEFKGSSLNGVGKAVLWVGLGSDRLGSSLL